MEPQNISIQLFHGHTKCSYWGQSRPNNQLPGTLGEDIPSSVVTLPSPSSIDCLPGWFSDGRQRGSSTTHRRLFLRERRSRKSHFQRSHGRRCTNSLLPVAFSVANIAMIPLTLLIQSFAYYAIVLYYAILCWVLGTNNWTLANRSNIITLIVFNTTSM